MDQTLLQRTRYVLRSRARRVQTCPPALFVPACQHFLKWVDNHPVLSAIAQNLRTVPGEFRDHIDKVTLEAPKAEGAYDPGFYSAESSQQHAAVCLKLVQAVALLSSIIERPRQDFTLLCLGEYLTANERIEADEALGALRDVAVDGLYEYLDEQLDARNVLYAILLKYKQRAEWFHRARLRSVADDGLEGRVGERALALDLQEYVLNQGVEFVVEPASASGEADLVLRDSEGRYIIIDAKYILANETAGQIRGKIASGFNQISRYCNDYNEPEGYLVAFTRHTAGIRLDLDESDGLHFLTIGGRTIYYLSVSIADLPTASRAGRANEVILTRNQLVNTISGVGLGD